MQRKSLLVLFFKVFVLLGVFSQGFYLFVYKTDVTDKVQLLFNVNIEFVFVVMTLFLMLVNWSLEAIKWQYIIKWIKVISFYKAIKTVLLGLAFSFFTPRGIGEYFARAYTLDVTRKLPIVLSLLLARMTQLFVLVLGGVIGGFIILEKASDGLVSFDSFNLTVGVLSLLLSVGIVGLISLRFKVKIKQVIQLLKKSGLMTMSVMLTVTLMSLIRYLTYCLQFLLLVLAFGVVDVSLFNLFGAVMFTFLMKALVPVFNFMSDLGVREVFAVIFLSMVGVPEEIALSASLLLWFINIVLPTIAGALLVFKTKISW